MSQQDQPANITVINNAGREAREQAKANKSIFAPQRLKLDDSTVIEVPPHPNLRMFDEDGLAAMERLNFELESYDRHDDIYIPEQKVKDKAGNEMTLPAETKPGPLKTNPHRKTDPDTKDVTLLDPPYEVQVVQFALGEEDYAKLRAGTINGKRGGARHVWQLWNEQGSDLMGRADADSKSDEGTDVLEDVATPDSE